MGGEEFVSFKIDRLLPRRKRNNDRLPLRRFVLTSLSKNDMVLFVRNPRWRLVGVGRSLLRGGRRGGGRRLCVSRAVRSVVASCDEGL